MYNQYRFHYMKKDHTIFHKCGQWTLSMVWLMTLSIGDNLKQILSESVPMGHCSPIEARIYKILGCFYKGRHLTWTTLCGCYKSQDEKKFEGSLLWQRRWIHKLHIQRCVRRSFISYMNKDHVSNFQSIFQFLCFKN